MNDEWMRATDVAKRLGVHVNTVKRLPADDLPYLRLNRRGDRRYRREDVERYIASNTVTT